MNEAIAHAELAARLANCEAYDNKLDELEIAPNGDDYNALIAMLRGGPAEMPHTVDR